jgi:tetratricopeptide (TPR) repeat protein
LLGDDPIAQARLCDRHAAVASNTAALTSAVRWLNRGFRCLEHIDGREVTIWRARMRSTLGGVRNRQGRYREAIAACRQAITEAETVGELSALAHAFYVLDLALMRSGAPAEPTHSWRAIEIYEQLGDPEHEFLALNNLGGITYEKGRWDEAVELYTRAGTCAERAGRAADAAFIDCNIGEILSDQGRLDEAEAHLNRARQVWSATGDRYAAYVEMLLGRLWLRRGRYDEGLPRLEQAASELRRFGIDMYTDLAQALIAEAEAFRGDPFRALDLASSALQASDQLRPLLTRVAGLGFARLGQREAAIRELRHSLGTARERGADYDVAATIDVLDAMAKADRTLLAERDAILGRLKIKKLPVPALDLTPA